MPPVHDMENEQQNQVLGDNMEKLHADESSNVARDQWRPRIGYHDVVRDDTARTHLHYRQKVGKSFGSANRGSPNLARRRKRQLHYSCPQCKVLPHGTLRQGLG